MKEKKLFDAITNIDDRLIDEARNVKKRRNVWLYRLLPVAACLLIAFGVFYFTRGSVNIEGALVDVAFPKAYAFDDSDTRRQIRQENEITDEFKDAINTFCYNTAAQVLKSQDGNVNYSPTSLYYALSMAATGAKGDTQAQILELLGVDNTDMLGEQCGKLYRLMYTDNKISKLKISNSLWLNKYEKFNTDFVTNLAENYYAHTFNMDFSDPTTADKMSQWVKLATNGTIDPEIELSQEHLMSIFSTLYYHDEWIDRFDADKTEEDDFHLPDGTTTKIDFMNRIYDTHRYFYGDKFVGSTLGLKGQGTMFFILPDEGVTPRELLSDTESVKELFECQNAAAGEVVWQIPKMDFGSNLNLSEAVKALGITDAFEPNADFSSITEGLAYINSITQDTHIAIDENGVEASAFTKIDYAGAMPPDGRAEMILDRPFIYGITSLWGELLFVGIYENPNG